MESSPVLTRYKSHAGCPNNKQWIGNYNDTTRTYRNVRACEVYKNMAIKVRSILQHPVLYLAG